MPFLNVDQPARALAECGDFHGTGTARIGNGRDDAADCPVFSFWTSLSVSSQALDFGTGRLTRLPRRFSPLLLCRNIHPPHLTTWSHLSPIAHNLHRLHQPHLSQSNEGAKAQSKATKRPKTHCSVCMLHSCQSTAIQRPTGSHLNIKNKNGTHT